MLSKGFVGFEAEGRSGDFDVIYGRDLSSGRAKRGSSSKSESYASPSLSKGQQRIA